MMTYNPFNLSSAQGTTNSQERTPAPILWTYSTTDSLPVIMTPDYIKDESDNALSQYLKVGDIVHVNYGPSSSFTMITKVGSLSPISLVPYNVTQNSLYAVGLYSTGGGATTETFTINYGGNPVPSSITVIACLSNDGPNNVQLVSAVSLINRTQVTLTFTADPGIGTLVTYAVFALQ
jgi:hypothetical protein